MRGARSTRAGAVVLAAALLAAGLAGAPGAAAASAPRATGQTAAARLAAPAPTPARTGTPTSIAVLGDSISAATGTGQLSAEMKQNSWATGTVSWSMRGQLGIATANAYNQASNGRRMVDLAGQASSLPTSTQYVVIEMGGNDLCRPSVGEMTSPASYRAQLQSGLAAIRARVPNALIFVASVPDIYNLWFLRGAPASVNPYVSDQVGQAGEARFFWDNFLNIEVPCQSLLNSPTSLAPADVARRDAVRARNLAFNEVLRDECGSVLRCRYDDDLFFNFSSNRANPPHGPLLPRNQWGFEDRDISNNHKTGSIDFSGLCPVNFTYNGCGDHFHPSLIGQQKLANAGMLASYQWASDATAPTVALTPSRPADGAGKYATAVNIAVAGSDAAGVRGYEVRVHQPNGSVGPWVAHVGTAPTVSVSATGLTYVEARALDVNGNLSASTSLGVEIDPAAFGTLAGTVVDGDGTPIAGATVARHAAATQGALESATTGADGRFDFGAVPTGSYTLRVTDPSGTHVAQWFDGAASHATATPVVVGSQAAASAGVVLAEVGLAGQVTEDGTGTGVAGAWVLALHRDDHTFAAAAVADGDGRYELGLAPGDHEVFVVDATGDHAAEWSGDSPTQAGADTVTVAPGAVETLDVALAPAGRTASISGTVTDEVTGDPVPGALAFAVSTGGVPTGGAVADAAGDYVIEALPAGSYHVIVFDGAGAHRPEFFDDATGFNDGDPVTLAAGASVVADAALAPTAPPAGGAALTGHITDSASGAPLEGAVAIALRSADYSFVAAGLTDATGAYALDVGPGQYRVELIDPTFLHAMEWYDDLPYHQIADAVGVDVAVGTPAVVDAALDPAGPSAAIAGTVTGIGGAPFEGALVLAIGADGSPAGGAVTGADGTYFIPGLTTGNHLVVFVDPSGAVAPEFHDDAASPADATLVTTAAGQITPVDAALTPAP